MLIDEAVLEGLLKRAEESPRRRMNLDMRTSAEDGSQRMLNALLPGTEMPIHRHRHSTETFVVLRGSLTEIFYDENGAECARYEVGPARGCYGISIPVGQWHTLIIHEPTVIFEAKDGPYEPLSPEDILDPHSVR